MSQTEVQLIKDAVIVNADVSGSAAIDVSKISGAMPSAGGSFTDDVTFTGANYNLVWDKSDNALEFSDNSKLRIGDGPDLQLYHTGSHSYIREEGTGSLRILGDDIQISNQADTEGQASFTANGAVQLYYDGSVKLTTSSTGVALTGNLELGDNERIVLGDAGTSDSHIRWDTSHLQIASAGLARFSCSGLSVVNLAGNETQLTTTENGSVELYHNNIKKLETSSSGTLFYDDIRLQNDNDKLQIGAGQDIQIYHNGTDSYIDSQLNDLLIRSNGDDLILRASDDISIQPQSGENGIQVIGNDAVKLFYDGVEQVKTSSTGITLGDDKRVDFGTGSDLKIYHDGTSSYVSNTTGNLYIEAKAGETAIQIIPDGAVDLRHNGSKKIETTSGGVDVTGQLTIPDGSATGNRLAIGNSQDLVLYHDSSHSYLYNLTGELKNRAAIWKVVNAANSEIQIKATENAAVELYYDHSKKFETVSDGVNVTGTLKVNGSAFSTSGGFLSSQQFTSSGTWTRPSGVTMIRVYVTGGGGGAGGGGAGSIDFGGAGGAGGTAIEILDVSSVSSATITIGAAGSGGSGSGNGSAGGTSSFGSYCSATGGGGGIQGNFGANKGGTGGVGSGGNINLTGGDGGPGQDNSGISTQYATAFGVGGASYWGGGGGGSSHSGAPETGKAYGSGGGAAHSDNFNTGAAGKPGFIYVEQYS